MCVCMHACLCVPTCSLCVCALSKYHCSFISEETNKSSYLLELTWSPLSKKINSELCLSPPDKDFMSFVCCFGKDLEPPMLKSCIFNSPQASKTNCQRQASIYKCTNCLQSHICLFYQYQTWRLHTGRRAGGEQP